jgi:hypothetical protein
MSATTADAWRAKARKEAEEEAQELKLPSGMTIRARRPGPALLASHAQLPLGLATLASGENAAAAERVEASIETAKFLYDLLIYCVVSPKISRTPGPSTILPGDLPDIDVKFIIAWAMRGEEAARLATFRTGRGDGAGGSDGGGVRPKTEHADGDRRSRAGAKFRPGRVGGAGKNAKQG